MEGLVRGGAGELTSCHDGTISVSSHEPHLLVWGWGGCTGEVLVKMKPEELASDARKQDNSKIRENALFEAERGQNLKKATTDQFQCGKCKQRKTTYFQMQTRSADEPMTTFVTCVNCGNRWKFC